MRNLGMRSTFQSLPLPIDSGGESGRVKRLYSCEGEGDRGEKHEPYLTSLKPARIGRRHMVVGKIKTIKTATDAQWHWQ